MEAMTNGPEDKWLMDRVFHPILKLLSSAAGKSNFFWARVSYMISLPLLLGVIAWLLSLVAGPHPGAFVIAANIFAYFIISLGFIGEFTAGLVLCKDLEAQIKDGKFREVLPAKLFNSLMVFSIIRLGQIGITIGIGITTIPIAGLLGVVGTVASFLFVCGGFWATDFLPPGISLWSRAKAVVLRLTKRLVLLPSPVSEVT